jgi:Fe2+ transport system protein A
MILAKGTEGIQPTPLAAAPQRSSYLIDRISGPDQRRLCEMGLVEGAEIQIVNRAQRDMMVVKVGGSRLALARGMADHVWVK